MAVSRSVKLRAIGRNKQAVFFMFRNTGCQTYSYIVEVSRNK